MQYALFCSRRSAIRTSLEVLIKCNKSVDAEQTRVSYSRSAACRYIFAGFVASLLRKSKALSLASYIATAALSAWFFRLTSEFGGASGSSGRVS